MLLVLAFSLAAAPEYVFVPDNNRYVWLLQRDRDWVCRLDSAGNFIVVPERSPRPGAAIGNGAVAARIDQPDGKPCYEFRSGRLIPGAFHRGNFIPELGGKIIDFKEYRYSKDAPRIYNLPGRFEPKK